MFDSTTPRTGWTPKTVSDNGPKRKNWSMCDCCSTEIRYETQMTHPTGRVISVGSDCADKLSEIRINVVSCARWLKNRADTRRHYAKMTWTALTDGGQALSTSTHSFFISAKLRAYMCEAGCETLKAVEPPAGADIEAVKVALFASALPPRIIC